MRCQQGLTRLTVLLGTLVLVSVELSQAQPATAASGNVKFTVTAVGKIEGDSAISKDDVQLFVGKERKQIGDWKKDDNLFLAILIDDSIDPSAASNWKDLKEFIMAQPATVHIAVGYIRNNTTVKAQDFTTNHEMAAEALRMPIGVGALGSSPYLGTMNLLKQWPQSGPRRSILLISSGVDYFRGRGAGPIYPDVDSLIQRAERQNTNIWTVYYPSAGHRGRSFYAAYHAQNNLGKLSGETGAESYYLGSAVPVSLKPFFEEIGLHLSSQYLLTFAGSDGPKGKYERVKVKTELPGVEFFALDAIYLPPSK
jgi:hypothetical protein